MTWRLFAAWWVVLTALWLLFISSDTWPEGLAGAAAGALAAGAAVIAQRAAGVRLRPRARWWLWALPVPREMVTDTAWIAGLLWRRLFRGADPQGEFQWLALPPVEDAARLEARNAMATVVISATPGTFVVGIDPESHWALLHSLTPGCSVQRRVAATGGDA